MRTIFIIVVKEFRQIFRNKAMIPLIFALPVVQLVLLALAADFEVKHVKIAVVDKDGSTESAQLTNRFAGLEYFQLLPDRLSPSGADLAMGLDQVDIILEIPAGFAADLVREGAAQVLVTANAIDGVKGGLGASYTQAVIQQYYQDWQVQHGIVVPAASGISFTWSNWYNPRMDYKTYMVPGILGMLVTMIGMFLSAMNVAREREVGTIEQLNVTPIKKYQFIIGKLLPFVVIALVEITIGLAVGMLLYKVPFVGSPVVLYGYTVLYMIAVLGIGLLISSSSDTQQQAMFMAWFLMVIFIFLSGFFTAIENMPNWARILTYFNPVRYFMDVVRMVMLKGSGWADIAFQVKATALFALVVNALAVWSYQKRVG